MVIVDTLEKVRGQRGNNPYADDYKAGTALQSLVTVGVSVIAVHHTRKGESEDFLDDVSGTLGLAGSVDTVITLKRARNTNTGTLSVTGRDVEEKVYSLSFVAVCGRLTAESYLPQQARWLSANSAKTCAKSSNWLTPVPRPRPRMSSFTWVLSIRRRGSTFTASPTSMA